MIFVRPRRRPSRDGFTLLELVIVLSIVTMLVAIAWPRLRGKLAQAAPREAALQLKADLAESREIAIRQGVPVTLQIREATGLYRFVPQSISDRGEDKTSNDIFLSEIHELPREIVFTLNHEPPPSGGLSTVSAVADRETPTNGRRVSHADWPGARSEVPLTGKDFLSIGVTDGSRDSPDRWLDVVRFSSSGRAEDAKVSLVSDNDAAPIQVTLSIRGLTGGVSIGQPFSTGETPAPRQNRQGESGEKAEAPPW